MRKFFAILLLSVHLFTLCGYGLVLNYFEARTDKSLVKKLDRNDYKETDLITIKIPLNLPYADNSDEFERCDGTIKINGNFYNYVKRKINDDTLFLECIFNKEKNKLSSLNEYAKNDDRSQSSSNERSSNTLLKLFFLDKFFLNNKDFNASLSVNTISFQLQNDVIITAPFLSSFSKPPEKLFA